jgi:hypothetical protein
LKILDSEAPPEKRRSINRRRCFGIFVTARLLTPRPPNLRLERHASRRAQDARFSIDGYHLIDGGGIEWLLASQKVRSMPRRPVKITQGEIARVIRAAKEAGAAEVVIDGEGQIRVVLSPNVSAASTSPSEEDDDGPVWTMSVPARKKRWSSRDATSWREIPKHLLRP